MICFSCGKESEKLISDYCPACNRERKRWASGVYEMYAELRELANEGINQDTEDKRRMMEES